MLEYLVAGFMIGQSAFNFHVANKLGLFDDIKNYTRNVKKMFNPRRLVSISPKYKTSHTLNKYKLL